MVVHHGLHIRALLVDGAVNEAFQIRCAAALVDWRAVKLIFDDIVALDALGGAGAR